MENIEIIIQIVIAIGIFNVWIVRLKKPSIYRGGNSESMESEFKAYGFNNSVMKIIGFSKLALACLLILGIWYPDLVDISAFLMGCLMIGAIGVHIKLTTIIYESLIDLLKFLLLYLF